jgi:hypothetical protein
LPAIFICEIDLEYEFVEIVGDYFPIPHLIVERGSFSVEQLG